jgi:two-component system sensor histidine kinase VicK
MRESPSSDTSSDMGKAQAAGVISLVCAVCVLIILILFSESGAARFGISGCGAAVVFSMIVLLRNLSAEKAAFGRLLNTSESSARTLFMYETAIRQIKDGIIILNTAGDFLLINEATKSIIGVSDKDLENARYDEAASGFSEKLERENILAVAAEGTHEDQVNYAGGIYRLQFTALERDEKNIGAVCVISDITESFKAEDMQTDFVANVSHELKTPLTTVKSYAETLLDGGINEREMAVEFLEIIKSEADRMDRLVRDLLLMTRMDYSPEKWDMRESDITSLVRIAMKKLDVTAKSKALTVNRMFDAALSVPVEMDRDRMEQVILNILSNAVKYTNEKGRIDVDIIVKDDCVQIVISDNGIGIPEKALARVFERFFRVDKARSRQMGGSGLGLAISKQIVDGHGGSIGIESRYGKGTKVLVTLPRNKANGIRGKRGIA